MRRGLAALGLMAVCAAGGAGAEEVTVAKGAMVRGLDKLTGKVEDVAIMNGEVAKMGHLLIALGECRYPVGNPAGDAFAFLAIGEEARDDPIFTGWMIASSPALNAMDHRRYDVWVLRCITE